MPCRDDWGDEDLSRRSTAAERNMLAASLCAVMTVLEKTKPLKTLLNEIDWDEAGVKPEEFMRWWREHKAEDARRRKAEAKERERNAARAAAMTKLTPEERKLLGVR